MAKFGSTTLTQHHELFQAILAIHDHVITNNARLHVTHNDKDTWTLTLKNVMTSDRGPYMCQINSDPMRSQVGN